MIGAAEWAEIAAGAPAVVLAPGVVAPHVPPLLPLVLHDGVLRRPGAAPGPALPLPPGAPLLAVLGPPAAAAPLLARLPPGLPALPDLPALLGLFAARLQDGARREAALAAECDRLRGALAPLGPPRPALLLDLAPDGPAPALPLRQPLGRSAEGLARLALHLDRPAEAGLAVTLAAAGRVLAAWRVPGPALRPGWLALDLPEPVPPGAEEAVIEIAPDPAPDPAPCLSAASGGGLALRLWTAPEGQAVLPAHFDWRAAGTPWPAPALPLTAGLLAQAEVTGAAASLVAAGEEEPRLLLELPAGGAAAIAFPGLPGETAGLLRARLLLRGPVTPPLAAAPDPGDAPGAWRDSDAAGRLDLFLPLGAGGRAGLRLRHAGTAPAAVEVSGLVLLPAEPRALPAAEAPARGPAPALVVRGAPAARFQGVQARHEPGPGLGRLDVTVTGLVSAAGVWRQLRTQLVDQGATLSLVFRDAAGWPALFEAWPGTGQDAEGPVWRLAAGAALPASAPRQDRALVAALIAVLPWLAEAAAADAGLDPAAQRGWRRRARAFAAIAARLR